MRFQLNLKNISMKKNFKILKNIWGGVLASGAWYGNHTSASMAWLWPTFITPGNEPFAWSQSISQEIQVCIFWWPYTTWNFLPHKVTNCSNSSSDANASIKLPPSATVGSAQHFSDVHMYLCHLLLISQQTYSFLSLFTWPVWFKFVSQTPLDTLTTANLLVYV